MDNSTFRKYVKEFPAIEYALSEGCYESGVSRRQIEDVESVQVRYLDQEVEDLLDHYNVETHGALVEHQESKVEVFVVNGDGAIEELKEVVGLEHCRNGFVSMRHGKLLNEALLGYSGFRYVVVAASHLQYSELNYEYFQEVGGGFDSEGMRAVEVPQPSRWYDITIYRQPRKGKWGRLYGPATKRVHSDPVSGSFRNALDLSALL